jgi:sugar lactone lactonase YvrE
MNRLLALTAVAVLTSAAGADDLYFAELFKPEFENGYLQRTTTEGGAPKTLVDTGYGIRSIQVDADGGKVYWCDAQLGVISRANLDGSGREDLVTGIPFPAVLRIDPVNHTMYWGDQVSFEIRRANLDGSENELVVATNMHRGLAIDNRSDKIYWSTSISMYRGEIKRCDFDGSHIETVVTSQLNEFKPSAIVLDSARGRIYWTDYVVDVVQSATLDGDDVQTLYVAPGNWNPEGIALDRAGEKIYWGQNITVEDHVSEIRRMDFDGAHMETILGDLGQVNDIVLAAPTPPGCYPDFDGNGTLDLFDFLAYVNSFNAGSPDADCDGNQSLDLFDFLCFVNAFNAGC